MNIKKTLNCMLYGLQSMVFNIFSWKSVNH